MKRFANLQNVALLVGLLAVAGCGSNDAVESTSPNDLAAYLDAHPEIVEASRLEEARESSIDSGKSDGNADPESGVTGDGIK